MPRRRSEGFTLIELLFVILIMGSLIALAIPNLSGYRKAYMLQSAAENIASQLALAREKAIATDSLQTIVFQAGFMGSDYHIQNGSTTVARWSLPRDISYYWGSGTNSTYRMNADGRCLDSGFIIVQDTRGIRDTISVLSSGLVLMR